MATMSHTLDDLARDTGTFLMVAMDQRESLRTMLLEHGHDAGDDRIVRFKAAVARELSPHASGFLADSQFGLDVVAPLVDPSCGLILAVDALTQEPGAIVEDTAIDEDVDVESAKGLGAVALKLLVIWRDDDRREERVEMSRHFVELAAGHGLLSVLEPVVRTAEADREAAIVTAAGELGAVQPSLYKAQVPLAGRGDPAEITRWAREIDAALPCPWVVLSQGVEPADFPRAVEASCKGGASGMLAGRAVWTSTLDADDPTDLLRQQSVPRLRELAAIVDAHATPWREKRAG
jgi:sulfofructosephosphate aldolase